MKRQMVCGETVINTSRMFLVSSQVRATEFCFPRLIILFPSGTRCIISFITSKKNLSDYFFLKVVHMDNSNWFACFDSTKVPLP